MTTAAGVGAFASDRRVELTIRGLILGALICVVFTAANVYLGLKVGLTFASSIPAAVISMAVLRLFRSASIQENNIVQTVASAAGTLSSIIFVLPGLVMVGWWSGFPFWQAAGVCAAGGVLGVMYTIPLRRALVTHSDLPYPEGVAAAEVLKVGVGSRAEAEEGAEGRAGLLAVIAGSIISAGFAALSAAKLLASEVGAYFRIGPAATGMGASLSFALIGVGHLIGLSVGLSMLGGLVIAWGVATPLLTALHPVAGAAEDVATSVWAHQVRFIGAGAIGASAIWTLTKLVGLVWRGLASAMAASRRMAAGEAAELDRTERDMPIAVVGLISLATLVPLAVLLIVFLKNGAAAGLTLPLVIAALIYIVAAGFLVATVCGYMAGLIGSSNSPVSGLAILAVLGASLLLLAIGRGAGSAAGPALTAFALFVTAILLCVATIANDNLQDLKTGQLVDATPWRQQVALLIGVAAGAVVIPPVLDLLNHAYGFAGAPRTGLPATAQPLPAPQATLISALAQGVIQGKLDWGLMGIGVLLGIGLIALDEALLAWSRRSGRKVSAPPLGVSMGIYLPASTTLMLVVGAIGGFVYDRWAERGRNVETVKRLGVLLASGLIVGESLFGVALAGLIVGTNKQEPLTVVGDVFQPVAIALGIVAFAAIAVLAYGWVGRLGRRAAPAPEPAPIVESFR